MGNMNDGAFRTILNDCRQMIIPVINEIFKEDYTGNEIIEFHPNEHFIDQQDAADKERITDTNFIIFGKKGYLIKWNTRHFLKIISDTSWACRCWAF